MQLYMCPTTRDQLYAGQITCYNVDNNNNDDSDDNSSSSSSVAASWSWFDSILRKAAELAS